MTYQPPAFTALSIYCYIIPYHNSFSHKCSLKCFLLSTLLNLIKKKILYFALLIDSSNIFKEFDFSEFNLSPEIKGVFIKEQQEIHS